jgi:hypothetical protein
MDIPDPEVLLWTSIYENNQHEILEKYKRFYGKSFSSIVYECVESAFDVGKYVDTRFSNPIPFKSISITPHICINGNERVMDHKRLNESKFSSIFEAVIKTYPTRKLKEFLSWWLERNVPSDIRDVKVSDMEPEEDISDDENARIIDCIITQTELKEISPIVQVMVPFHKTGDETKDKEYLDNFIGELSNKLYRFGYSITSTDPIKCNNEIVNGNRIGLYSVTLEARYTETSIKLNDVLYHVTTPDKIEKIRRRGLEPRSNALGFDYPERVYLFNGMDIDTLMGYGFTKGNSEFCILQILRDKLVNDPAYRNGTMRFYIDPFFADNDNNPGSSKAIFTYSNIRPELLNDAMIIVKVDSSGDPVISKASLKDFKYVRPSDKPNG